MLARTLSTGEAQQLDDLLQRQQRLAGPQSTNAVHDLGEMHALVEHAAAPLDRLGGLRPIGARGEHDRLRLRVVSRSSAIRSRPDPSGSPRSMTATYTSVMSTRASANVAAFPATAKPPARSNAKAIASRTAAWSSTSSTHVDRSTFDLLRGRPRER